MTVIDNLNKDLNDLLFKRVKKFIEGGHYRYTIGFSVADNFLIFKIGNEKSIHINPIRETVNRVDDITGLVEELSPTEMTVVQWFIKSVNEKISVLPSQADLIQNLLDPFYRINSVELFFFTELAYFKSLFSGYLTAYCFNTRGEYAFVLPDKNVLHVYISRVYLDDNGFYFIENRSQPVSTYEYEPHCSKKLLHYLKTLCQNPENLQNLAQV